MPTKDEHRTLEEQTAARKRRVVREVLLCSWCINQHIRAYPQHADEPCLNDRQGCQCWCLEDK